MQYHDYEKKNNKSGMGSGEAVWKGRQYDYCGWEVM